MEFSAGDKRSPQNSSSAPEALPAALVTAVSAMNPPLLQGGIPLATNASDALLWREIEKQKIRQEILAKENWRWELEQEVRAELALERLLGISNSRHRSLVALRGFSFLDQPSLVRPHLNLIEGVAPQVVAPTEHEASSQSIQDNQVFVLDKNDPQVCGVNKRKAETAVVSASSGPNKILKKQGFTCELCQVSATSEEGLHDHLRGKKHTKKEASLKIGLDEEAV